MFLVSRRFVTRKLLDNITFMGVTALKIRRNHFEGFECNLKDKISSFRVSKNCGKPEP
jgi:hypothetical protein